MSSLSGIHENAAWARILRVLDGLPNDQNRDIMTRYLEERRAAGIRMSTLGIDANALRAFCLHLGEKRVDAITRADVVGYFNTATTVRSWRSKQTSGADTITRKPVRLSERTLHQRKQVVQVFLKWLRGTDETPPEMKGLRRAPKQDFVPADELITRDDLQAMLQACVDVRGKAILAVLAEGGLRAAELCALRIRSVEFDRYGAVVILPKDGMGLKTGARRIRLFDAVPYLHAWYEIHPHKDDPHAPLFHSMSRREPEAPMNPSALLGFCVRAGTKANLKKHIHPHLFRHTAATEKARLGWNEGQLRAYFGWSRNSDMPSTYVHLAGLDYEDMELARRGMLQPEDFKKPILAPLVCRVCRAENLTTATFCQKCRNPVSPEAEAELARRRDDELKEAAARLVAQGMQDEIARAVRQALTGGKEGQSA